PSGELDQSWARISAPTLPPPSRKVRSRDPPANAGPVDSFCTDCPCIKRIAPPSIGGATQAQHTSWDSHPTLVGTIWPVQSSQPVPPAQARGRPYSCARK